MRLEDLQPGQGVEGLEPDVVVTIAAVMPAGDDVRAVYYKRPDGGLRERLLTRSDETSIAEATKARPWSFAGDPEAFKLTAEAKRIDLAFLFDPAESYDASPVGVDVADSVPSTSHVLRPCPVEIPILIAEAHAEPAHGTERRAG